MEWNSKQTKRNKLQYMYTSMYMYIVYMYVYEEYHINESMT